MPDLPIACTLTPDGMTARLALIEALAAAGLLDRTPTDAGLRVRLRETPDIEQRTRELVAAESRCCTATSISLVGAAWAAATASSTIRASARLAVRTFSTGSMCPSLTARIGLTASAEPSRADAEPIRPPRRRYSRVSTQNTTVE